MCEPFCFVTHNQDFCPGKSCPTPVSPPPRGRAAREEKGKNVRFTLPPPFQGRGAGGVGPNDNKNNYVFFMAEKSRYATCVAVRKK